MKPKSTSPTLRPPAVPLVVHDPNLSVWSFSDNLTDDWSKHWTGLNRGMTGLVRVDGRTFHFAGSDGRKKDALHQDSCTVLPTRTIYTFSCEKIALTLTFLTPLLPDDLDLVGRPLTYVVFTVRSIDGKNHSVQLYYDITGEWATNHHNETVVWSRYRLPKMSLMRVGTVTQQILQKSGDNIRSDWGYMGVAVPDQDGCSTAIGAECNEVRALFRRTGRLADYDDLRMPMKVDCGHPPLSTVFDLDKVGSKSQERRLMLAWDDLYCIEYLGRKLHPWWQRDGKDFGTMLAEGNKQYRSLAKKCADYDERLMGALERSGGKDYAQLCALAFRQSIGAHKLAVDIDGTPLFFSKENASNGCIATVDVTYPSAPIFLLLSPKLLKAMLKPILEYASSTRWRFDFAPHDLGTFPLANGQVYGGGEMSEMNQMPVEECGNMLTLIAALTILSGDSSLAREYDHICAKWADYLIKKGLDPENQLCTDDFAGHLAHNTNLSLKAIVGLGAYAKQLQLTGQPARARTLRAKVKQLASRWTRMADNGDHYRLAFDKKGTWSQKYNIVWDRILGLNLFPASVARKEVAFYKTKLNTYGLPLDNRKSYTKLDWCVWSATLAEKNADFRALMAPLYRWVSETPTRVPLTDWFETESGKQVGFQARSVVGGLFIKMLADRKGKVWK